MKGSWGNEAKAYSALSVITKKHDFPNLNAMLRGVSQSIQRGTKRQCKIERKETSVSVYIDGHMGPHSLETWELVRDESVLWEWVGSIKVEVGNGARV